jgi:hypothetical protein
VAVVFDNWMDSLVTVSATANIDSCDSKTPLGKQLCLMASTCANIEDWTGFLPVVHVRKELQGAF